MYSTFHSAFPVIDIAISIIGRATMNILACNFRYLPPSLVTEALTPSTFANDHHETRELD
jgi:hypothetical protein